MLVFYKTGLCRVAFHLVTETRRVH